VAFTESDLDAVREAIASGELRVDYRDRSVTYRSVAELKEAKSEIEREIAGGKDTTRPKQFLGVAGKGF